MPEIYFPDEDSYLMSEVLKEKIPSMLKKNSELKFLEVGSGSGINLETAFSSGIKKQNVFSCDINPDAVAHCKKLGFNCVMSDLFSKISKNKKFGLIIFNPPYLPDDSREPEYSKTATTGGRKGNEIIIKFLTQARSHLEKKGKIFLLTSSLTPKINYKKLGFKTKKIAERKLFFEKLFVRELFF